MSQPLEGIRVVELAEGIAGPYTGKLLADFGADVVKVEPPGGDLARRRGPFLGADADPERCALFLHLNTNKSSVVADLSTADGRALVQQLVAGADLVVESARPGTLDSLGLGYRDLARLRPGIVVVSVTSFGQSGPYAGFVGEEIVHYALGGPMSATGQASREPVKMGGEIGQYQCGGIGATAALGALRLAEQSGRSVHVDLSNVDTQVTSIDRRMTYLLNRVYTGRDVVADRRGGPRPGPLLGVPHRRRLCVGGDDARPGCRGCWQPSTTTSWPCAMPTPTGCRTPSSPSWRSRRCWAGRSTATGTTR